MSDDQPTPDAPDEAPDDGLTPDEEASLGDAGKQAIEREKAKRKAAIDAKNAAETRANELAQQLAEATRKGDAADVEAAVRAATTEIAAEYQAKVVASEIRAAAAGRVVDVDLLGNLPEFAPTNFLTASGEVDQAAIATAIDDLLASKSYLAAQGGRKGSADGGARNEDSGAQTVEDWMKVLGGR
jgi:hypothetical protein